MLDEGRIIETGYACRAAARGGIYARLWRRQSGGFDIRDTALERVAGED